MTSQSFLVSCSSKVGLAVLHPTGSESSRFWYIITQGIKIANEYFFCYTYQYIVKIVSGKGINLS